MESEKACQRSAGDIRTAAQEHHDPRTDDRYLAGDLRPHLGRKKCQRIPRQQVSAEAKAEC